MTDLLLFDLDGTLSDPVVGIGRSINHALSHFGHPPLEMSEVPAYVGPPLDETFQTITGVKSSGHISALVSKFRERYSDVGYSENVLYPGIGDALAKLRATGVPLGVCTSKRKDFAERILEMFDIRSDFRFVDGGEIGVRKWQQIERLLSEGVIPRSGIMVGDRGVDLVAGHKNGLRAAGVLWGYGSRQELEHERPLCLLGSPVEIPALARAGILLSV
jgi:phosphoglycolate phosphatase